MAVGGFYVGKCRFLACVATISGNIYGGKCRKRRNRCEDFTRRHVTNWDMEAKQHRHAPLVMVSLMVSPLMSPFCPPFPLASPYPPIIPP